MQVLLQRGAHIARQLAAAFAIALAMPAGVACAQQQPSKPDTSRTDVDKIAIVARPLAAFDKTDTGRKAFGELQWLGGLVLSSDDSRFGGWSGLAVDAGGKRIVAVSDAGTWMTAELVYDGVHPKGVANARLGPLKASDGGRLKRDRDRDAEAVVLSSGTLERGQLLVAFEQNHRIVEFPITSQGVGAPVRHVAIPHEAKGMRALKGLETLTVLRGGRWKGALLVLAEHMPDKAGHHSGWIMAHGKTVRFSMSDIGGFDPTDAVSLANGDVIVLERRFRWLEGVKMRLRRVKAAEFAPGAVVTGEVLLEANMTSEIDNMEAISAHVDASGATILTILSDDNFNGLLQRTLLLQFRPVTDPAQRAARR